jgi:hypothetical protein
MKRKIRTNSRLLSNILADYQNTFLAFIELINNSIQANAKNIKITIEEVPTTKVSDLHISFLSIEDDGYGVPESEFENRILEIATEYKNSSGGMGIGRFSAFQLANNIDIETVSFDDSKKKFTKVKCYLGKSDLEKNLLDNQVIETDEEELLGTHKPYYKVSISDFHNSLVYNNNKKKKVHENLLLKNIANALFERYANKIFNKEISFFINNAKLEKDDFVIGDRLISSKMFTDKFGIEHKLSFTYYNVKKSNKEVKVFLTSDNGGIQNVIKELSFNAEWIPPTADSYFIYIDSKYFTTDMNRNLDLGDMDENIKLLNKFIKDSLNKYFTSKYKEFGDFTKTLRNDKYYPYKEKDPSSKTKEIIFTKFAYFVEDKYLLLKNQEELRSIIYSLIDKSISNGHLEDVLKSIITLSKESTQKFSDLIKISPIESVIEFSEQVAQKNNYIDILYELTYGDISKKLKERSELHKIIEKQLWIFGERYADTPFVKLYSDKNLEDNLNKLRGQYFEYSLSRKDDNIDEEIKGKSKSITDLFFYNEKILDNDKREIMIVELKSPSCKIGHKEITQVEKYANQIINSVEFSKQNYYKIILISSRLSTFAETKIRGMKKPNLDNPFCIEQYLDGKVEIWLMTWMDIIDMNRKKMSYLGKVLKTNDNNTSTQIEIELNEIKNEKVRSRLNTKKRKMAEVI